MKFWRFEKHRQLKRFGIIAIGLGIAFSLFVWCFKDAHIRIAKDTTVITAPLGDDGLPDYVAALNAAKKPEGVTPENNSAVLLFKALGPGIADETWSRNYARALGIDPLPEDGDYFIEFDEFAALELDHLFDDDEIDLQTFIDDMLNDVTNSPWTSDEFPDVAKWLNQNKTAIQLTRQAATLPKHFIPYVSDLKHRDSVEIYAISLPNVHGYRNLARLIAVQTMLQVGEERVDEAKELIADLYFLADCLGQGRTVIERLTGRSVQSLAIKAERQYLFHADAKPAELLAYHNMMKSRSKFPNIAICLNEAERYAVLQTIALMSRGQQEFGGQGNPENPAKSSVISQSLANLLIDWNTVLIVANEQMDRFVEMAKLSREDREKDLWDFDYELTRDAYRPMLPYSFTGIFLSGGKTKRSRKFGRTAFAILIPAFDQCFTGDDINRAKMDLTLTVALLQAYFQDHGEYPWELSELVPEYSEAAPIDLYTGELPIYKTNGNSFLLYSLGFNKKDDDAIGREVEWDLEYRPDDIVVKSPGWED